MEKSALLVIDVQAGLFESQGYDTTLVSNAHSTYDTEVLSAQDIINHHNLTLASFAEVVNSKGVVLK